MDLSVVIPAYNEAPRIADTLERIDDFLSTLGYSTELIVVDDGSADETAAIVERWVGQHPTSRLVRIAHSGKGAAVRTGMLAARGARRFLADADLSMPIEQLSRLIGAGTPDADIVIASREAPGARRIGEPWTRHVVGRLFNWMVRLLLVPGIQDSQCGFKVFSAAAAEQVFPRQTVEGFGFDVEVLYIARRAGLRIREVGIDWVYFSDTRVTLRSGANGFLDILRIRLRARAGRYADAGAEAPAGPETCAAHARPKPL